MSRPLRIEYPGAWYHVMNRGRRGEEIFSEKNDYSLFLDVVQESTDLFNIKIIRQHINTISSIKVGGGWEFFIKVFTPAVLLGLLSIDFYHELSEPYGGYSWTAVVLIGIVWLLINLIVAFILATRPWKTDNHKLKGRGEIQE